MSIPSFIISPEAQIDKMTDSRRTAIKAKLRKKLEKQLIKNRSKLADEFSAEIVKVFEEPAQKLKTDLQAAFKRRQEELEAIQRKKKNE